ncbi:MAG: hypothetical protein V4505_25680 [Pseudomonadota bacterium]
MNSPSNKATDSEAYAAAAAGLYVLLWSHNQCATHIESLETMLRSNRHAFADDRPMDYIVLHVGTDDACHAASAHIRSEMHARQEARGNSGTNHI